MKKLVLTMCFVGMVGVSISAFASPALVSPYDTTWELNQISLDPAWNTTGIMAAGQTPNGYYVLTNRWPRSGDSNPAIWIADSSGNHVNHQYEYNVAPNAKDIVMGQDAAWIVTGGSSSQLNKWLYSDLTSGSSTMVASASDGGYWTEMILDEADNTGYINDRTNKKIIQVNLTTGAVSDWLVHNIASSFGLSWGPDGVGGDMYLTANEFDSGNTGHGRDIIYKIDASTKAVSLFCESGWYWDGGAGGLEYLASQNAFYTTSENHWRNKNSVMEIDVSNPSFVETSTPWTASENLAVGLNQDGSGLLIADWNDLYEQKPVPEPTTIGLLTIGILGFIRRR